MSQIRVSHKAAGSCSRKIRKRNRVSAGVGLVDKSKRDGVHGSRKGIFTRGPNVPRILMQGDSRQKARCSFGSGCGDGISVEPPKRPAFRLPIAGVVAFRSRPVSAGCERREETRWRAERLM